MVHRASSVTTSDGLIWPTGVECTPATGQFIGADIGLCLLGPIEEMTMGQQRRHTVAFKKQVVDEFLAGESLHTLSRRYDVSRSVIRVWVKKADAKILDSDIEASELLQEYEARIAALERLVGKLSLENEFLKGASTSRHRPSDGSTFVISGPAACQSRQDAD